MNVVCGGLSGEVTVKSAADLTSSGSTNVVIPLSSQDLTLFATVASLTGGGSFVFVLQELDPVSLLPVGQNAATGSMGAGSQPQQATITGRVSSTVKVSWTLTGTSSASSIDLSLEAT
jgi:hypothetical protein